MVKKLIEELNVLLRECLNCTPERLEEINDRLGGIEAELEELDFV